MTGPPRPRAGRARVLPDAFGPRTRWLPVLLAVTVLAAVALFLAVGRLDPGTGAGGDVDRSLTASQSQRANAFLDTYVEAGRVVRLDQGGDTVSEGQAYGMLIAVAVQDERAFAEIWRWTRDNLGRPDGLLSWRWADGAVADESSASDADLDAARALVLAGETFDDEGYTEDGLALGTAMLDHETVQTDAGRVLVAGQWATTPPYVFNPSYVSPAATSLLGEVSDDPRWAELEEGSRRAVAASTPDGQLPPDWAEVAEDGTVTPVGGPAGEPVRYAYDAPRTLLRHAESCEASDRAYAAEAAEVLGDDSPPVAVYDLAGSPQTDIESSLSTLAQAAALGADGQSGPASEAVAAGIEASDRGPTYYGDAWVVLGQLVLESEALGGCRVLGGAA